MKATEVTAGLAESNGSLLPGIWRNSLHVTCGLSACTPGSAPGPTLGNEYRKTLPLPFTLADEFSHNKRWADTNGLIINFDKTKELVLHRPRVTRHNLPQSLAGIKQVLTVRLLGVIFQSSLSFAAHD